MSNIIEETAGANSNSNTQPEAVTQPETSEPRKGAKGAKTKADPLALERQKMERARQEAEQARVRWEAARMEADKGKGGAVLDEGFIPLPEETELLNRRAREALENLTLSFSRAIGSECIHKLESGRYALEYISTRCALGQKRAGAIESCDFLLQESAFQVIDSNDLIRCYLTYQALQGAGVPREALLKCSYFAFKSLFCQILAKDASLYRWGEPGQIAPELDSLAVMTYMVKSIENKFDRKTVASQVDLWVKEVVRCRADKTRKEADERKEAVRLQEEVAKKAEAERKEAERQELAKESELTEAKERTLHAQTQPESPEAPQASDEEVAKAKMNEEVLRLEAQKIKEEKENRLNAEILEQQKLAQAKADAKLGEKLATDAEAKKANLEKKERERKESDERKEAGKAPAPVKEEKPAPVGPSSNLFSIAKDCGPSDVAKAICGAIRAAGKAKSSAIVRALLSEMLLGEFRATLDDICRIQFDAIEECMDALENGDDAE